MNTYSPPNRAHLWLAPCLVAFALTFTLPTQAKPDNARALVLQLAQYKTRDNARNRLIQLGKAALPALRWGLQHKSWALRAQVAKTLAALGPKAKSAIPDLVKALQSKQHYELYPSLVKALSAVQTDHKTLRPILQRYFKKRGYAEGEVYDAYGKMGIHALPEVPALMKALRSRLKNSGGSYALIGGNAAKALAKIALASPNKKLRKKIIRLLCKALWAHHYGLRAAAARAIGSMGEQGKRGVSCLISLLETHYEDKPMEDYDDQDPRPDAATALGQVGLYSKAAKDALKEAAQSEEPQVKKAAKAALNMLLDEEKAAKETAKEEAAERAKEAKAAAKEAKAAAKAAARAALGAKPGQALFRVIRGTGIILWKDPYFTKRSGAYVRKGNRGAVIKKFAKSDRLYRTRRRFVQLCESGKIRRIPRSRAVLSLGKGRFLVKLRKPCTVTLNATQQSKLLQKIKSVVLIRLPNGKQGWLAGKWIKIEK